MDYKIKMQHAERVAEQLQNQKTAEQITSTLKEEGLYERDITNILVSARKIVGETYRPKIRQYLMDEQEIHDAEEFSILDSEIIDTLIENETKSLALQEKKKITKLVKEGLSPEEVYEQVNMKFLPGTEASDHITNLMDVKRHNSGTGRMMNFIGGIGLIALTGILAVTTDRLFYVLPFIGLLMIVKGFTTMKMEYDR